MKVTLITRPGDKSILFSAYYGIGALARMYENVKTTLNLSSKTCSGRKTQGVTVSKLAPFFLINVLLLLLLFSPQLSTLAIDTCYRHCLDYPSHQVVRRCDMTKQHTAKKRAGFAVCKHLKGLKERYIY